MYLLGYDIGSDRIRVALIDGRRKTILHTDQYPEKEMEIITRQSGWAEQEPESWWYNFCVLTRRLLVQSGIDPRKIGGIGLSYQMHGLVMVDEEKEVLRPSIIWCDSRAVPIGQDAFQKIGPQKCLDQFLNAPGNFTASKLKWVMDHEPEIFHKTHKILLPGDYIAMMLTGKMATTIGGLSEGVFWNFKKHRVAIEILDHFGLNHSILPEVVPTFGPQGRVSMAAAQATGLAEGTPLTYRAGDQPSNALALNVLRPGELAATGDASGVVYGIVDHPVYDHHSHINAFAHVNYEKNYDRIGLMLCLNGAGNQYNWLKQQFANSGQGFEDMERMAATLAIGSDGVCILPFGNGAERMLDNQNIHSHIFNLQFNRHNRAHLYRASLEGIAFSFAYGVEMMKKLGMEIKVVRVGMEKIFHSRIFSTTLASLLGCRIEVFKTNAAIGAARAAGVGNGLYASLEEALREMSPEIVYEPELNPVICQQAYQHWLASLQQALLHKAEYQPQQSNYSRIQQDKLKSELLEKSQELAMSSFHLVDKNEFLRDLLQRLEEVRLSSNLAQVQKELVKISQKLKNNLKNDNSWQEFEEHFDQVNSSFFKKLKAAHPELTLAELKLCSLLQMKRSTKDIATHLNLTVRGIETRRFRLRKKLDLDRKASLDEFLDKF